MKRIGTFSSAIGLILLGVWMIIEMRNPELGNVLIKWWPLLIIILGIEVLIQTTKKENDESLRLSRLVFPIIFLYIFVNIASNSAFNYTNMFNLSNFRNTINNQNFNFNIDNNWASIKTKKVLPAFGNVLTLSAINSDVKIVKSEDSNITIEAEIYYFKSKHFDNYTIKEDKTSDGYGINFEDNYIKLVKTTVYLPKAYNIILKGSNMQVKSESAIEKSSVKIEIVNGNVDLNGDIEKCDIKLSNGKVNLTNKYSKDININLNNGLVLLDTLDNNISVDMSVNFGLSQFNSDKSANSKIVKSIGTGEGKIKIGVNNGTAKVLSTE